VPGVSSGARAWKGRCTGSIRWSIATPSKYTCTGCAASSARNSGDVLTILDADLEYDPQDFVHLLEPIIDGDANVVETYISYLRQKVDATAPPLIHTVRGIGYMMPREPKCPPTASAPG